LHLIITEYGEAQGILLARKHMGWYSKGMHGAAEFRRLVNSAQTGEALLQVVADFLG
jgi:tRNA-dihydrouridine synthase B